MIFLFYCYLATNRLQFEEWMDLRNQKYWNSLIGMENVIVMLIIFNYSNLTFTGIECLVLLRGLDFCIPHIRVNKEQIFIEFLFTHLNLHKLTFMEKYFPV